PQRRSWGSTSSTPSTAPPGHASTATAAPPTGMSDFAGGRSRWAGRSVAKRDGQIVGIDLELLGLTVGGLLDVIAEAHLGADPLGDLDHDLGVVGQELLGVLPALAELLAFVGVPGARLLHDLVVDADIEHTALATHALPVHDVELGLAERWRAVVGDDIVGHEAVVLR